MRHDGGLREVPWRGLLAAGVAVLALSVGLAGPAGAATRFVATTGSNAGPNTCLSSGSPCQTITHALTQAVANDTISVATGTYNLALGETFPLTINTNLTLNGAGAGSTIIDATGSNTRVITINSGVTATITGVTIMGGAVSSTNSGGGFSSAHGGGIRNEGILTLTTSTISVNSASCTNSASGECEAGGGGLSSAFGSTLTVTASTVSGNTATCTNSGSGECNPHGGGLSSAFGSTVTVTASTVSGNTATCTNSGSDSCYPVGGGLINFGTLTLTNSTVSGNTATCTKSGSGSCQPGGGGLDNAGTLTLTNSTVSGNTASCTNSASGSTCIAEGGGLFNEGGFVPTPGFVTNATVTNSTLSGNTATCTNSGGVSCGAGGGGLFNGFFGSALMTLTNTTVTANSVTCSGAGCTATGGGLNNAAGTTTLQNTIVAKQLVGADCTNSATLTSNGFNLASDNTCQLTQPSDKPNVSNPLLGPLQSNGGPTQTHALLPGSPAIDAVTSGCPPPATDQRGIARPQGATCDIGAFEFGVIVAAVQLNGSVFHTGQQIDYQATLNPGFTPTQVDIYLGALLPDGVTFVSLMQVSPGVISFTLGPSPIPFSANVTLTQAVILFSYIFNGFEPVGTYFMYAGLVIAGSDPFVPANQLSLGVQPFQFAP